MAEVLLQITIPHAYVSLAVASIPNVIFNNEAQMD